MIRTVSPPLTFLAALVKAMLLKALSLKRYACALCLCLGAFVCVARGQQEPPPGQTDEVVRVSSELVQTDVMVFDKQGKFVENLQREQFELKIDGKSQPISFFERIKAGSVNEDAQLAAARGDVRANAAGEEPGKVVPLDRGRVVLFYVDDLHLSAEGAQRVRLMLLSFIETELGQNDEAAITSASGQIGFLQQLTGDKTVLRAAINRLQSRSMGMRDFERPLMSPTHALAIARFDQEITNFFVERLLADNPGLPRQSAEEQVRRRASALLQQTSYVTTATLETLNNTIRFAGEMPGRKLLFFISEGFLIDDQTSNVTNTLRQIADSAARTGVVIYSMDARGLISSITDSTVEGVVDPSGRLEHLGGSEITATQAPLRALAADTGGRALLNTNSLKTVTTTALQETATYYLLAWRPNEEQQDNKFRKIEVSVVGKPGLVVRVRKGFIEQAEKGGTRRDASAAKRTDPKASSADALLNAIFSRTQLRTLPTTLFVSFADAPNTGSYIIASMEMDGTLLDFTSPDNKQAMVDVGGIIYNDQGKPVSSFQNQLTVKPPANGSTEARGVAYNYQTNLKPGLYQVRVAARDSKSGRSGSAVQWIEIPDLATRRLSLSSLVLGERTPAITEAKQEGDAAARLFLSISRRFSRNSRLRFLTQIYNAALATGTDAAPDVALQVQIFRDNQPILTTALSKVETKGVPDLTRLPYAAEIPLNTIPAGRYRLQVTVIDRIAKTSASQHVNFEVG